MSADGSSATDAPVAPTPAKRPGPAGRRRARPAQKVVRRRHAVRVAAVRARVAKRMAEQQKRVEQAKAYVQRLIDEDIAERSRRAAATRPPAINELIAQARADGRIPPTLSDADIPIHPRYNLVGVHPATDDQLAELIAFGKNWSPEYGGLGAFGHLRNFVCMTWPDIQFNPWLEAQLKSLCDDDYEIRDGSVKLRFVNWVGAGSAGKTFAAGLFACCWFMFDFFWNVCKNDPPTINITLTSTSKAIIAQRVWPVIQKLYHDAKRLDGSKLAWGHMIESKKMVQARKGDEKHSIFALAVETGEVQKALDQIKGRHTPRMMVIVDEANATPQAIFETLPNMLTSVRHLIVLVIGNAGSRLDPHGLCCEPRRGWKSVTIEDTQWETKGVAKWGIGPGVCLRFDGAKSPNVLSGRTDHKFIYTFERWQQVLRMGDEYRNTLQHWSQDRGFWPPDGMATTVFTEAMVLSHDGGQERKFHWITQPRPCGALDPAFGGDNCVFYHGLLGDIGGGTRALQILGSSLVPFDPDSPDSIDLQIARWVIARCRDLLIEPNLFGLDATGVGRGAAAFIQQNWSNRILAVEFGGKASDQIASLTDPRQSHEVYANRVTELWYAARETLVSDQLKGLDPESVRQFCSRLYRFVSRRYIVETKEEMKVRLGYSPDYADAVTVLHEVARRNGLVARGAGAVARFPNRSPDAAWHAASAALTSSVADGYTERAAFSTYADVDY